MRISKTKALKALVPAALFSVAGCVSATAQSAQVETASSETQATSSPDALLRPYYDGLKVALPQANSGAILELSKTLTRIAFGSCNHQGRSQHMWSKIGAQNPDIFLAIGDNVYGDFGYKGEADMMSFINAYRQQAAHPEFQALRSKVPMMAVWDDHDFGPNDSGGTFAFRKWSEKIFESFWRANDKVKSRPGIYDAVIAGPVGQRVQIIMLDTRFFRSPLKALPYQDPRPPLGGYIADDNPDATVLGSAQWAWLKEQLAKPVELRIIASSIQVLTDAHGFEKWGNFPADRDRLYGALKNRRGGDIVMLSGDRHSGATYAQKPQILGEQVWELTSSSLNLAFVRSDADEREPDPSRKSSMITQENFGLVDIDWASRNITLRLMDAKAQPIITQQVKLKN